MKLTDRNGGGTIHLSNLVTGLVLAVLTAGGAAILGVGVLSWRANASEGKVEDLETRQRVIEGNQIILDGNQRLLRQDSSWARNPGPKLRCRRRLGPPFRAQHRLPRPPRGASGPDGPIGPEIGG